MIAAVRNKLTSKVDVGMIVVVESLIELTERAKLSRKSQEDAGLEGCQLVVDSINLAPMSNNEFCSRMAIEAIISLCRRNMDKSTSNSTNCFLFYNSKIIPRIVELMTLHIADEEHCEKICWAIAVLASDSEDRQKAFGVAGAAKALAKIIEAWWRSPTVIDMALRAVRNLSVIDEISSEFVIQAEIIPALKRVFEYHVKRDNHAVIEAITWAIVNLSCDSNNSMIFSQQEFCGLILQALKQWLNSQNEDIFTIYTTSSKVKQKGAEELSSVFSKMSTSEGYRIPLLRNQPLAHALLWALRNLASVKDNFNYMNTDASSNDSAVFLVFRCVKLFSCHEIYRLKVLEQSMNDVIDGTATNNCSSGNNNKNDIMLIKNERDSLDGLLTATLFCVANLACDNDIAKAFCNNNADNSSSNDTSFCSIMADLLKSCNTEFVKEMDIGSTIDMYSHHLPLRLDSLLSVIRNLTGAGANAISDLVVAGTLDNAIFTLVSFSMEERFYENSLNIILNLNKSESSLMKIVTNESIFKTIIIALKAYPGSEPSAIVSFRAMSELIRASDYSLTAPSDLIRKQLLDAGILRAAVDYMTRLRYSEPVVRLCCNTLLALHYQNPTNKNREHDLKELEDAKAIIRQDINDDTDNLGEEKIYVSKIDNWTFDEVCTAWLERDSLKPFLENQN